MPERKVTVWQIDSGVVGGVVVDDLTGRIVRDAPCYRWMMGMMFEVIRADPGRLEIQKARGRGGAKNLDGIRFGSQSLKLNFFTLRKNSPAPGAT
jgi:hypothetical protein